MHFLCGSQYTAECICRHSLCDEEADRRDRARPPAATRREQEDHKPEDPDGKARPEDRPSNSVVQIIGIGEFFGAVARDEGWLLSHKINPPRSRQASTMTAIWPYIRPPRKL